MTSPTSRARNRRRRLDAARTLARRMPSRRGLRLAVLILAVVAPLSASAPSSATPLSVTRSGGADRAATAVAVSKAGWPSGARTALVARSDVHPDALAAAPLAAALDAPLLLTRPDRLEQGVIDELKRLGVRQVLLLGGPSAISEQAKAQAAKLATVRRVAGANRYATAKVIADELAATTGTEAKAAYVARGSGDRGWADALSVAPLAGRQGRPLLLADDRRLPYDEAWLGKLDRLTLVGGEAVLRTDLGPKMRAVRSRLAGANRYATSLAVADAAVEDLRATGRLDAGLQVWLATGTSFPDALAAGPAVANRNAVLLLAPPRWEGSATRDWIVEHADQITEVRLLGSSKAVPDAVAADLTRIDPDAPQPSPSDSYTYQLMYSARADRSGAKPLDGATVSGPIYVFLARCEADGSSCVAEW